MVIFTDPYEQGSFWQHYCHLLSLISSIKWYICQCVMGSTSKTKKKTKQGERKYSPHNFRSDLVKINLVCGITLCFCGKLCSDETVRIKNASDIYKYIYKNSDKPNKIISQVFVCFFNFFIRLVIHTLAFIKLSIFQFSSRHVNKCMLLHL